MRLRSSINSSAELRSKPPPTPERRLSDKILTKYENVPRYRTVGACRELAGRKAIGAGWPTGQENCAQWHPRADRCRGSPPTVSAQGCFVRLPNCTTSRRKSLRNVCRYDARRGITIATAAGWLSLASGGQGSISNSCFSKRSVTCSLRPGVAMPRPQTISDVPGIRFGILGQARLRSRRHGPVAP